MVKQGSPAVGWFFTWNNYTEADVDKILTFLKSERVRKYAMQEEKGEEGTPHLQGQLILMRKARWSEFTVDKAIHWEKTRNEKKAVNYCLKEETRNGRQWIKGYPKPVALKLIEPNYKWQQELLQELAKEPTDRGMFWYFDFKGGVGKSQFTKWMMAKMDACLLCGKRNDVFHGVLKWYELKGTWPTLVIYDIPRSNIDYISYDSLESIKNGAFFSGKYEGGWANYNPPHVVVFANEEPARRKMSEDKWIIRELLPSKDCVVVDTM